MSDSDDLERRLAAVERAVDGEGSGTSSDSGNDDALQTRLDALETRIDELDAAVQAIRGFLGGVSAVNEAVERRADAAVAAVERLETRIDDEPTINPDIDDGGDQPGVRERLRDHW